MRKLRRFWSRNQMLSFYANEYDHTRWVEHKERVLHTVRVAQRLIDTHGLKTVADLSCGDRAIVYGLTHVNSYTKDLATGDDIMTAVDEIDPVDLFICTETIEHLEAPWTLLEKVADVTQWLVLSTPLDEDPKIGNWEHYWSFTLEDVGDLLTQAGFVEPRVSILGDDQWTYTYQIWTAKVRRPGDHP